MLQKQGHHLSEGLESLTRWHLGRGCWVLPCQDLGPRVLERPRQCVFHIGALQDLDSAVFLLAQKIFPLECTSIDPPQAMWQSVPSSYVCHFWDWTKATMPLILCLCEFPFLLWNSEVVGWQGGENKQVGTWDLIASPRTPIWINEESYFRLVVRPRRGEKGSSFPFLNRNQIQGKVVNNMHSYISIE